MEKHYQAVATDFELAAGLIATNTEEGKAATNELITSTIDTTRDDLLRSLQARYFQFEHGAPEHPRRVVLNRVVSRIPESRAAEFQERLCSLLKNSSRLTSLPARRTPSLMPLWLPYIPAFTSRRPTMAETTLPSSPSAEPKTMRTFLTIWTGQFISMLGSGLTSFAIGVWIFQQTGQAMPFALTVLFGNLPGLLLLPLAGSLADRWNRKALMILADSGNALTTLGLFILLLGASCRPGTSTCW